MHGMLKIGLIDSLMGLILMTLFALLIMTVMSRASSNLVASVSDLRESSAKLTEIAGIIDTSSKDLSNYASAQAAAMEETSSSYCIRDTVIGKYIQYQTGLISIKPFQE